MAEEDFLDRIGVGRLKVLAPYFFPHPVHPETQVPIWAHVKRLNSTPLKQFIRLHVPPDTLRQDLPDAMELMMYLDFGGEKKRTVMLQLWQHYRVNAFQEFQHAFLVHFDDLQHSFSVEWNLMNAGRQQRSLFENRNFWGLVRNPVWHATDTTLILEGRVLLKDTLERFQALVRQRQPDLVDSFPVRCQWQFEDEASISDRQITTLFMWLFRYARRDFRSGRVPMESHPLRVILSEYELHHAATFPTPHLNYFAVRQSLPRPPPPPPPPMAPLQLSNAARASRQSALPPPPSTETKETSTHWLKRWFGSTTGSETKSTGPLPAHSHPAETSMECCVCTEQTRAVLFRPCNHLCVCTGCCEQLRRQASFTCPLCRQVVTESIRVYL